MPHSTLVAAIFLLVTILIPQAEPQQTFVDDVFKILTSDEFKRVAGTSAHFIHSLVSRELQVLAEDPSALCSLIDELNRVSDGYISSEVRYYLVKLQSECRDYYQTTKEGQSRHHWQKRSRAPVITCQNGVCTETG